MPKPNSLRSQTHYLPIQQGIQWQLLSSCLAAGLAGIVGLASCATPSSHSANIPEAKDSGHLAKDSESLSAAESLTPENWLARAKPIDSLQKLGELNQAILLNPEDAAAYNNRGLTKAEIGNYPGAIYRGATVLV